MADAITKALQRLSPKQRAIFKKIIIDIANRNIETYDVKQLKDRKDVFRIRKGEYRIIFLMKKDSIALLSLEKRGDNTY